MHSTAVSGQEKNQASHKDVIVVDVREFSSLTPIYLAERGGFWLVPMTLTVGDYVLSDEVCVERKAFYTGDLQTSFQSGRLLQQITNMERYFQVPILLIEFDDSVPFKLVDNFSGGSTLGSTSTTSMGYDISPASLISKLTLLTVNFKKLRLIWSKSPAHTAQIFQALKRLYKGDPDLNRIEKRGKVGDHQNQGEGNLSDGAAADDEDADFNRFMPQEFLKRLPGLDESKVKALAKKGKEKGIRTIVDLCGAETEQLSEIIGQKSAREVKAFLERKIEFKDF